MRNLIALLMLTASADAMAFFPELPFCPFGGPPGWYNRVMHERDVYPQYRYPPYWSRSPLPYKYRSVPYPFYMERPRPQLPYTNRYKNTLPE